MAKSLAKRFPLTERSTAETEPRERRDLASEAYRQLRDLIVTGGLAPGAPIIEARAAARLGLSRTPLRAALQRLQQQGYVVTVTTEKYSRAIVAPLTADDMKELFYIMGALEGVAAARAATLDRATRLALGDELEETNAELLRASEGARPDVKRAQDLHVRFHRPLAEAAAGPRLMAQIDALHPQVERYERLYTYALIGEMRTSVEEHAAIIAAIRAGKPDQAERTVQVNWRSGAERFTHEIVMHGERGIW